MQRTTLSMGGPPQLPAPQFVTVAGEGPQPIIRDNFAGQNFAYVPSGPNRFYSYECSAQADSHCSLPGWAGWWRQRHGEPRRRPPSSTHDAKEAAAIVSMTVHEGYLRLLGLRRLMLEHTTSASRCGRFGSGPTRVPGKSGPPRWRPITCSHSRNG